MNPCVASEYTPADKEKVFELIKEILGECVASISLKAWDWLFINNPFIPEGTNVIFAEKDKERPVSLYAKIFVDLKIDDEIHTARWTCYHMVHPKYRSTKRVSMAYLDFASTHYASFCFVISAFAVKKVLAMARKRPGVVAAGYIFNFIRVLNANELFRKKIKNKFISYIGGKTWDTISKIFWPLKNFYCNISVSEIAYFDERFNKFWQKVCGDYKVIVARTQKYLNWRFIESPFKYRIFAATKNSELSGYIALSISTKGNFKKGLIVDLLAGPDDEATINALIKTALFYFKENECHLAMCILSTDKASYRDALKRNGLIIKRPRIYLGVYSGNKEQLSVLKNLSNWFITGSDPDLDIWD